MTLDLLRPRMIAILIATATPTTSFADSWVVAETSAALAVSDVQERAFRPGVMPAIGVYVDNDRVALGLRMRLGVLNDGPALGENLRDPGLGGLGTGGAAVRLMLGGGWTEVVVGGGITGRDIVPVVELGVGWSFAAGTLDIGPSARYVRVISPDRMHTLGTAELALVGLDVRFGKDRPRRQSLRVEPIVKVAAREKPPAVAAAPEIVPVVRDEDRLVENQSSCMSDLDGCYADLVVKNDRIVLDERVLFDFNRARVRTRGRAILGKIARLWRTSPDWQTLTIEGHTDARGSDAYNVKLSKRRAERVRTVLETLGCTGHKITVVAHGRGQPLDPSDDETAHQRNRRVEFVIARSTERGGRR